METKELKDKLLSLREELQQLEQTGEEAAEAVALDQSRMGRLTRMDAMQAQAISKETLARRKYKALAIEKALKRIDNDMFGDCLRCGESINPRRLAFDPAAELCIECASSPRER